MKVHFTIKGQYECEPRDYIDHNGILPTKDELLEILKEDAIQFLLDNKYDLELEVIEN